MKNLDTGTVVFTKNADERIEPASTTKILTYIVVSENVEDLDGTTVTLTQELKDSLEGTGSSIANIMVGETMSIYEALNCLMVPSGNDAAVILADYVGGKKKPGDREPGKAFQYRPVRSNDERQGRRARLYRHPLRQPGRTP